MLTAESTRQEPVFRANHKRVYEPLTDEAHSRRVTQLSAAMQPGVALGNKRSQIGREPGGPFTLFGNLIVGGYIELVPNERLACGRRGSIASSHHNPRADREPGYEGFRPRADHGRRIVDAGIRQ